MADGSHTLWCLESYLPAHASGSRQRGASHMRCPETPERRHERSVCHEHRQFRVAENVASGAAKDHLPQSALGVGALDQEVAAQRLRVGQNRLTRHATIKTYGQRFCRHPVQLQIAAQLLPGRSGHRRPAFDRQYDDAAGTLEDGQRKGGGARLLGAAIPCNQNVRAHLGLRRRRRDQYRPAALEQAGLKRGHPWALRIAAGLTQDDHVEEATVAADKVVALGGVVQPTARQRLCVSSARHTMRLHEVFEEAAASLLVFRDVVLQCRYRHGGYVAHREGGGELNAQGEPFDVAVEFAREQECGLQRRVHATVLFDRHQNGLETHRDLPSVRASPAARAEVSEALDALRFAHNPPQSERHFARSLLSCQQPGKLDREQPDYLTSELLFCRSPAVTGCGEAGSCSTVACWPSHRRVSSTVSPSGNSSASWCTLGLPALICRNRATFVPSLMCGRKAKKRSYLTSCSNATSVPGNRHTATFGSPMAANPRVMEFSNIVVTSSSPTFAGRDATRSRL